MLHRVKSTRMTRIVTIATTLQNRSEREFGTDSSLEGDGFEPSVPQREGTGLFRDHLDRPPAPSPSREAAYLARGTWSLYPVCSAIRLAARTGEIPMRSRHGRKSKGGRRAPLVMRFTASSAVIGRRGGASS